MAFTEALIAALIGYSVTTLVYWAIDLFRNSKPATSKDVSDTRNKITDKIQEDEKTKMSEAEAEVINETSNIIRDIMTDDPVEAMKNMTYSERVDAIENLTARLIDYYELTDVTYEMANLEKTGLYGYYSFEDRKITVNVDLLKFENAVDNEESLLSVNNLILETIDTIVHELRHAVQYQAAFNIDTEYMGISREKRIRWAINVANYVSPDVDPKGYMEQPIEADAVAFAHMAVGQGVFNQGKE